MHSTPDKIIYKTARGFLGRAAVFVLAAVIITDFVMPNAYAGSSIIIRKIELKESKVEPEKETLKEAPEPVKEIKLGKASAISSDIEYLRTESENARAFADKQRKTAEQWQKKADDARKQADESHHKKDKEGWLDDARMYDERAENAAIDADKAEAKAAKAEAELVQVLKTLEHGSGEETTDTQHSKPPVKESKSKFPAIPLEQTFGVWHIMGMDSTFVIVQKEPGVSIHSYKLEAHTGDRVWKGEYSHFDEGDARRSQNARVVFKYTPKADEMNPEIPEWARKKIEGELEWQIELDDAGSCGAPALSGYFFPGEVKWNKNKEGGPVKIVDRGKPRPVELERVYDFELDMVGRPSLVVTMGGEHDPLLNPIEGLTKHQRFFVKVTLPKEMADKQGKTLDVKVKGLSSGEEDTITLTAGGASKAKASVNYTHTKAVTIADSNDPREEDRKAKFLSWSWWTDSATGARLDMDVKNGEGIEFSFNDMFETIPVYDSWVQRNIARYEAGAWRLRGVFEAVHDIPELEEKNKKEARDRLKMLDNMQAILDSGYLTDVHKHELLKLYVDSMVFNSPKGLDAIKRDTMQSSYYVEENRQGLTTGTKMLKEFVEGATGKDMSSKIPLAIKAVGTGWVSDGEKFLAHRTLKKASNSIKDQAFDELVPALAYGLYEGVVMTSGTGDLYLIATGDDHFGKKRRWDERVLAAVGLGSGIILNMHGGTAWSRFKERNIGITLGGKGSPVKFRINRLGAPVKTPRVWRGDFRPLYPESMKPAQRAQINLKPPPSYKAPKKAAVEGAARPPGAIRSGQAKPKYDPAVDRFIRDTEIVDSFYGPDGDILELDDRIARKQCYENCNIRADTYVHEINGKKSKSDIEAYTQMKKANLLDEYGLYEGKNPMQKGFPNKLSKDFNALNDFQTVEIPAASNASRTIEEIDMARKGLKADNVKIAIAVGNLDGIEAARKTRNYKGIDYHAVVIHDVIRDVDNTITKVQFFDPAVGRIVELPACQFNSRLAKHADYGNATLYFAPTKNKPIIQFPKSKKKPFIEWPEEKPGTTANSGADAPGSGKKPKTPIAVDEFDDLPLRPTTVDEFDDLPLRPTTVDEAIGNFYPDITKAPPLNVIEPRIHQGLMNGAVWEQPIRGGASFSKEGFGAGYGGDNDIVIRVNDDFAREHIVWVKDEQGRGLVPNFYPEGKTSDGKGIGARWSYIPREQLEYLDISVPGPVKWRTYPVRGEQ
ncbi:MAG: hypothetical protein A3G42_01305 [Gammaproteobacteria bacterium RIFCSPLOWO2_12_FULL_47_76]|nr:MAG: hypothetical protein A3G42_01305 [Gammaproteobacteria bacterium RIFCSPLOWO2_12_FULL_47_76]